MKPTLPNRRRFLGTCSTLAITAALGPTAAFAANQRQLKEISYTGFAAQVHKQFIVHQGKQTLGAFVLTQARKLKTTFPSATKSLDAGNEKFTLLFSGPRRRPLAQNTYTFEQAGLGRFDMFIAPIGPGNESQLYYEATFNRPAAGAIAKSSFAPSPQAPATK